MPSQSTHHRHFYVNCSLIYESQFSRSANSNRFEKSFFRLNITKEQTADYSAKNCKFAEISNYSINFIFTKWIMAARRMMLYLFSRRRSGFNWILDWVNNFPCLKCSSLGSFNYYMIHGAGGRRKRLAQPSSEWFARVRISRLGFRIFSQIYANCDPLLSITQLMSFSWRCECRFNVGWNRR